MSKSQIREEIEPVTGEHWLGLPVGITVRADGSLGISVDFGDATVLDNYDDEIAPEWLAAVAAALDEGNYSFED